MYCSVSAAGARHARRSDPLSSERTAREAGRTFQKTTAFVATALVPFAAKVSVVPCCVRFGTAERERAEHRLDAVHVFQQVQQRIPTASNSFAFVFCSPQSKGRPMGTTWHNPVEVGP